eukprot:jgi/Psemu1/38982/gm1.38982_g
MEYIRNQLFRVKESINSIREDYLSLKERAIVINPGQVEEVTHSVSLPGIVSLEELRFWAYVPDPHENHHELNTDGYNRSKRESAQDPRQLPNDPSEVQHQPQLEHSKRKSNFSYIDIAVLEISTHCPSGLHPSCDLPSYGIGKVLQIDDTKRLFLCDETNGRLLIDHDIFRGYHTELHIPPSGMLMKDRITDPRAGNIPSFPSQDTKYEVLIANCDQQAYGTGRNVGLSGQVVFESDPWLEKAIDDMGNNQKWKDSQWTSSHSLRHHAYYDRIGTYHQQEEYGGPPLDAVSQMKLLTMGLSICVLLSLFSLRIHNGTRVDYFRARANRANRLLDNIDGGDNGDDDDDGNNSGALVLLEHLLNLFEAEAVGALGIFVVDPQGLPCLRLVHGLQKYPGPLAQHSPNKNKAFGYLDDIEGEAGKLVLVDSAMLSPTIASRVLTLDHHLAELEAHPGRLSIPVIPEGTGHSKLIWAHKAFFIPFDQALGVLHPQLNRVGLMESCTPPVQHSLLLQPGPSFQSETGLTNYMKHKVMYHPALTAAVTALTDHQLKLSENMDHKRSQLVRTTWGPLYTQRLLLLCGKQEEANLPPIYQAWAQKSKHERTHMIFQSQVTARASELGIQAPLITTAALKRFQDGNFHGTDPFDKAAATVAAYNTMISTEGNSLTLKDSLELQKTKAYIPVDWTEATTQLESYLAVLATILGLNHDVVTSYQQGLRRLKIQQMPLRQAIADEVGEFFTPAIVVYYFQIRVRGCLEEQWEAASTIPSPDFGVDFHAFRMSQNLNWLPMSPMWVPRGSATTTTTTTATVPPAARESATRQEGPRLTNPHRDSRLQDGNHPIVKKLESAKMREDIQAMRDKGKERCHSWHIKGACFSSCKHIYDHMAITPTEQDQLCQWCQEAYA